MRTGGVVTGPTSLNISHEKERLKKRGRRTPKKSGRWVVRMSGLSEWMTDRQQPDRRLTARRRADSLPLCRAFATSSITDYRTCWSLSHSSTKSERTPDFVLSQLTGSMIIFERTRVTGPYPFTLVLSIIVALANFLFFLLSTFSVSFLSSFFMSAFVYEFLKISIILMFVSSDISPFMCYKRFIYIHICLKQNWLYRPPNKISSYFCWVVMHNWSNSKKQIEIINANLFVFRIKIYLHRQKYWDLYTNFNRLKMEVVS